MMVPPSQNGPFRSSHVHCAPSHLRTWTSLSESSTKTYLGRSVKPNCSLGLVTAPTKLVSTAPVRAVEGCQFQLAVSASSKKSVKRCEGILASSAKAYKFHLVASTFPAAYDSKAARALERNSPIEPLGGVPRSSHSQSVPRGGRWATHR